MGIFFSEIKKHVSLYFIFIKYCLMAQMEYRGNFLLNFLIETAFLFAKVLYAVVIYHAGVAIGGFSPDAVLLFIGSFTFMTGIYMALFFFNIIRIQEYVREGTLDMLITKPVSLQFMVSLKNMDLGSPLPSIVGGVAMIAAGWHRTGIDVSFVNVAGFIGFMITGTVITYCIMFIPQLLCFWLVKTNAVFEITDSFWNFNNVPMTVYNKWMQRFGMFLLPIFMVSNFSSLLVMGKLSGWLILWGIVSPFIFLALSRIIWKMAIRNYTSASS